MAVASVTSQMTTVHATAITGGTVRTATTRSRAPMNAQVMAPQLVSLREATVAASVTRATRALSVKLRFPATITAADVGGPREPFLRTTAVAIAITAGKVMTAAMRFLAHHAIARAMVKLWVPFREETVRAIATTVIGAISVKQRSLAHRAAQAMAIRWELSPKTTAGACASMATELQIARR